MQADIGVQPTMAQMIVERARERLQTAPVGPAFRAGLAAALAMPGNILSDSPNLRWAHPIATCCMAAGGQWQDAVTVTVAVELFMVALDILDDLEDGETSALEMELGAARTLNVSTGLLFLTQWCLLDLPNGATALHILTQAGLRACSGQNADLTPPAEQCLSLDAALAVTQDKSAALASAICRLGAWCAGADESMQQLYARFGFSMGMIRQLNNDIAALHPDAVDKTDIILGRPTLPLTYAVLQARAVGDTSQAIDTPPDLWNKAPAYLTWTVAEVYRRQALDLIPYLTIDHTSHVLLARLLAEPILQNS